MPVDASRRRPFGWIVSHEYLDALGVAAAYGRAMRVVRRRFQYTYRLYSWFAPYVRAYFEALGVVGLVLALFWPEFATSVLERGVALPVRIVEFGRAHVGVVLLLFAATYLYHVRDKDGDRSLHDLHGRTGPSRRSVSIGPFSQGDGCSSG